MLILHSCSAIHVTLTVTSECITNLRKKGDIKLTNLRKKRDIKFTNSSRIRRKRKFFLYQPNYVLLPCIK